MPSLSTFAYFTLANLGPLTTPYTAAPACATAGVTAGAPAQLHMVGQLPSGMVAEPRCPSDTGPWYAEGCWPSASRAASLEAALKERTTTTREHFFTDQGPIHTADYLFQSKLAEYFSPGVHCPAGWTTAGTVAWADTTTPTPTPTPTGDGTLTQVRTLTADLLLLEGVGVFSTAVNYTWPPAWDLYRKGEVLARALEPSETLAFCCPSNYEGYDNGVCVSTLGPAADAGFTEVCWRGPASGLGTSITTGPVAVTATHGPFGSATGPLTAYTFTPAVPLVYRASDMAAATATATTTTDRPAPTGTDATAEGEGGASETPLPNMGRRNAPGDGVVSWGWVVTALLPLLTGAGAILL